MAHNIPVISDELMAKVDSIFAHGGQRARTHDQRFGQWLVNKIRTKYPNGDVQGILFNLENDEVYDMLKDYND